MPKEVSWTCISYLGWHAYPVARLNEDTPSKHLLRDLRKWGVHLKFVYSRQGGSTPVIVEHIRHNAAGKALHTFSWSCPRCGAVLPRYKAVLAADARAIAAQIEHPQVCFLDRVSSGALILARASATQGALVVFEPSSIGDPRLFREALALAHTLKYSHERMGPLEAMFVALENHAQVEELVFYPSVEEETDDEGETLVEEARQEHQTVKELIAELRALDDEDAFETKFHELQQAVEHHVAEEATAMLPLAEAAREEEREDLGEQMREVKQQQSW